MTTISHDSSSLIQDPNNNNNNNPSYPNPNLTAANPVPFKRKRNLPGAPDPDSEVIALSPKSLTETNRFVCEICKKGFQRDQNLQLHMRGHNLPWKLKRSDKESIVRKKKVYVCPENSCVHHDPSRALGDLTGIKKHYSRKHGEKKWNCHKCSKKYAVLSDWKAHGKICGTKEYKCDCGINFSRKDSFTTHRAFCDALAIMSSYTTTLPQPNFNYRDDVMNHRPAATYGSLLEEGQSCLINWSKQFKLPTDHHGIGNYCHELTDNPVNNYWSSSSLASPAIMFPTNMAVKEEADCKGFSSNTLRAAAEENCYYGNEQAGTTSSTSNLFMSSSQSAATALLQKAVQMGSSTTTTTTTHDDHPNNNNNISSVFCNNGSNTNGVNMGYEQESLNLTTANNNMRMVSKGDYKIINGIQEDDEFVFGGDHHRTSNSTPMIHEAVDRSTTRDFLGGGGWSTLDMAKIDSLGSASASAMTSGHCSSTGSH